MPKTAAGQQLRQMIGWLQGIADGVPPPGALTQLAQDLEALAASYEDERNRALALANQRLADLEELHVANRLVTVGTLTAGMAHELGTPLGVVLARAQMIVADEVELGEARQDAEEIITQVKRMTQMCREVLDFARPKPPTRDSVDVVQILRQMIALLTPEARKRTAKLVIAPDPAPSRVLADPSKLMQVFTNLTINATQAMPNGGTVTVSVERAHVKPPIEGPPEGEYICVQVRDTGTGIRSADLAHIFETFFTTKKAGEGTGLGLAISYRIAREHQGWIGVVTEEGHGSTFTVYLPPHAP
jgi:signal transduction histidine kinase